MYAARDLGAHALKLYLYFASNANGYTLALSPAAIRQAIGMARSTYQDQIDNLIAKGYLVKTSESTFDFYEVPKPRHGNNQKAVSDVGLNFEDCASGGNDNDPPVQTITTENIEINNITTPRPAIKSNRRERKSPVCFLMLSKTSAAYRVFLLLEIRG